jgi:hypothetical protein
MHMNEYIAKYLPIGYANLFLKFLIFFLNDRISFIVHLQAAYSTIYFAFLKLRALLHCTMSKEKVYGMRFN